MTWPLACRVSFMNAHDALLAAERHQRAVYRHVLARIKFASIGKAWKTWAKAAGSMKGRKQYLVTLARIHTKLVVRGSVQVWVEFTKNVRLVTRVVKNITQKCV